MSPSGRYEIFDGDREQSKPHYVGYIVRPWIKRCVINRDWANRDEDQRIPPDHVERGVHGSEVKSDEAKKNPEKDCKANLDFLVAEGQGVFCRHFFISVFGFDVVIITRPAMK